jgi:hypothetical protein
MNAPMNPRAFYRSALGPKRPKSKAFFFNRRRVWRVRAEFHTFSKGLRKELEREASEAALQERIRFREYLRSGGVSP